MWGCRNGLTTVDFFGVRVYEARSMQNNLEDVGAGERGEIHSYALVDSCLFCARASERVRLCLPFFYALIVSHIQSSSFWVLTTIDNVRKISTLKAISRPSADRQPANSLAIASHVVALPPLRSPLAFPQRRFWRGISLKSRSKNEGPFHPPTYRLLPHPTS